MNLLIRATKNDEIDFNIDTMTIAQLYEEGSLTYSNLKYFEQIASNSDFHYPILKDVCWVGVDVENISGASQDEIKEEINDAICELISSVGPIDNENVGLVKEYLNSCIALSQIREITGIHFERYLTAKMKDGFYFPIPLEILNSETDENIAEQQARQMQ